jgi:cell division protein FtsQ
MARKLRNPQARRKQPRQSGRWLVSHRRAISLTLLFVALSVTTGFVGQWLLDPGNLPMRNVQIAGEFHQITPEHVRRGVSEAVSAGFFTTDVEAVRTAAQNLPWVDQAMVRRVWPDTVIIEVTEQVAAARWGDEALLNRRGELFSPHAESIPAHLPLLSGPEPLRRQVMEQYVGMASELARVGRAVARLSVNERRTWVLELDNGVELRLGREQTMARLQRFVRSYPRVIAPKLDRLQYVDLRYSNGFSVRWQPRDAVESGQES